MISLRGAAGKNVSIARKEGRKRDICRLATQSRSSDVILKSCRLRLEFLKAYACAHVRMHVYVIRL